MAFVCEVCGEDCRPRRTPPYEGYPFAKVRPQAPEPTPGPRRARRHGEDRMRRPETHERGGGDR